MVLVWPAGDYWLSSGQHNPPGLDIHCSYFNLQPSFLFWFYAKFYNKIYLVLLSSLITILHAMHHILLYNYTLKHVNNIYIYTIEKSIFSKDLHIFRLFFSSIPCFRVSIFVSGLFLIFLVQYRKCKHSITKFFFNLFSPLQSDTSHDCNSNLIFPFCWREWKYNYF